MSGIVAEVGRFYMVPCLFVPRQQLAYWMPLDGWVPVLGPKHDDVDHLNFPHPHYHIDWRFMPQARMPAKHVHSYVVTNDGFGILTGTAEPKRRKCRRVMPEHPRITDVRFGPKASQMRSAGNWQRLEYAHRGCRLKPGNVCPHRGIDLTPFIKPDGTVICPGHGLRWDTKTGELLPHHLQELEAA